jgi:multiple sugar transport system substrate-binding protein
LGGYVWPAIKSLDPLFEQCWQKEGIDMTAFLTEAHGKGTNFPVSSGMGAALQQIVNDLGPAWLGSTSVSSAVKQAGNDDDYALKTGN